ncbi:hypothetical protein BR1R3_07990 [Pseudomonas atacamensis]|nr:hypothetical protein BR1R3_07990 [Pseudomonas atacamensis]
MNHAQDNEQDHEPNDRHRDIRHYLGNFSGGIAAVSRQQGPGDLCLVSDQLSVLLVISFFYHAELQPPLTLLALGFRQGQKFPEGG